MSARAWARAWPMLMLIALARRAESGPEAEGCLAAGLCCSGRESSCLSRGWRTDRTHGECYCDQACGTLRDCCYDYDQACPAVPCVVSEWSVWSGCSEPCKATVRVRQRRVLQEPQNGGEPCPPLQQTAGCAEYHNQHGHCLQSLVPALITTGGYGNARKKREVSDKNDIIGYCVEFELTSLTSACQHNIGPHTQWMQYLREGHQVCVECQPPALAAGQKHCSGDGEDIEQDRRVSLQWQAVGNPRCRGVWRRVRRRDSCSCPTVHSFLFI
ncbi:hypothetical protein SRHO_G00300560 [Serrasalmus rhombeus]|uniref:somatomedin-B and thrombospondin type-1 domain-containing protein n=1 Tax=Pygocentrus nattereri TaxID=42514 RepID=UPI000814AC50|nr:somatomedin-B and thrombospondin type-1 domain-containing protein [Pygocentrus nattereri]